MSVARKANYVITLLPGTKLHAYLLILFIHSFIHLIVYLFMIGDGIGPEIMQATLPCLNALGKKNGFQFTFREADIGGIAIDRHNGIDFSMCILDV